MAHLTYIEVSFYSMLLSRHSLQSYKTEFLTGPSPLVLLCESQFKFRESRGTFFIHVFIGETINTGPGTHRPGTQGPEDGIPKDLAVLHLAFMTEMQFVSMF